MSDITCPNCSATLPAGAVFCTSCGHRMEAAAPPPPPPEDATRVESPGLHDSTQVIPPADPAASAPWQPTAPPANDWSAAPSAPPAAPEQPAWGAPAAPPAGQNWGAPAAPAAWGAPPQGAPQPGQPGAPGAPAWGAPAPAAAPGAVEPSPAGGGAALAGGVLAVIGLFIGWFKVSLAGASKTFSGWDLASSDQSPFESTDPYLILVLGLVGIAAGALLFMGKMRPIARIVAAVAGVAVIIVVLRDWMTASDLIKDTAGAEIKQEVGFFLPIVGGVLLAVGAVLPAKK